jgi:two-component system response regulator RstA
MNLDCDSIRALVIASESSPVETAVREVEHIGIHIAITSDPQEGLETARSRLLDAVVLDVKLLVSGSGTQFMSLRAIANLCIVALTTSNDALERAHWLEAGADDCMTVPCSPQELAARIRATVRCACRVNLHPHCTLQVGKLILSRETMHAEIKGSRLDLTSYEFALLWALARHCGKVMSREQLLELAKGSAEDAFDRSIDVQVSRLRRKLSDDPKHPRLLKTVRGAHC